MVWTPRYAIERSRSDLRERLQPKLADKRYGGVLLALVLGDQRAISDADWTLFNRTGIGHLVSISGLHITMIASLAGLAVGALWPMLLATVHGFAAVEPRLYQVSRALGLSHGSVIWKM